MSKANQVRFKSLLKAAILRGLYEKPQRIYYNQLLRLLERDAAIRGDSILCVRVRARLLVVPNVKSNLRASEVVPRASKQMLPEYEALLNQWDPILQDEQTQVGMYISHVLNKSDDFRDYLPHIPDGLRKNISSVYEALGIPMEGLSFQAAGDSLGPYQSHYEAMLKRVTSNLFLSEE
ncbi:hypothetical protein [Pseudomonas phage LUZ7]|uniref:Uncharacterized protein n=1 Tax=Pseudomonas phage LUZ7 TaxID=655097 RepID=C8ZKD5_9CAUD|nr:hypothetical protein PP-LUZ7_gp041 [Pseudomonas phage LUZ7]CAZ66182.1 hypothetical protein [Pseudomonas phage LUZ7]